MVMCNFTLLFCILFTLLNVSSLQETLNHKHKPKPTPYQDWDYILFSQRWPITSCISWEDKDKNNTCSLTNVTEWTVHGLWPTKTGQKGPYFCNTSIQFDQSQLDPIEQDLEKYWTNVEANTNKYSFWKHEWKKHGTCAVQLPVLNTPLKYFEQGLEWVKQYNLTGILAQSNIVPNDMGYTPEDIYYAVNDVLKVKPDIQCTSGKSKQSLLSEIRICFDKNLTLIDCEKSDGLSDDILSNCDAKKLVMYFNKVSTFEIEEFDDCLYFNNDRQGSLLSFYNLIKFLIWFTL